MKTLVDSGLMTRVKHGVKLLAKVGAGTWTAAVG